MATHKGKLLIVDDEPNIRSSVGRALYLSGFAVTEAETGQQALSLLQHQTFDLLLLDMNLPDISGTEVLKHVTRSHPDLQVIILTGYLTSKEDVVRLKDKVCDYLIKPIGLKDITKAVTAALHLKPTTPE